MKNTLTSALSVFVALALLLPLSCVLSGVPVDPPSISPEGGSFLSAAVVTLACVTEDAEIHYTLDGSQPTKASPLYAEPFTITESCTVQAVGYGLGHAPSGTAQAMFSIDGSTVEAPTFSPEPGTALTAQTVSISCVTPGAAIHYTVNGLDPDENSPLYGGPLSFESTTLVHARAYKAGLTPSEVTEAEYTVALPIVGYPRFSPTQSSIATTLTITSDTSGAEIWYTTDGTIPIQGAPSTRYTAPFPVNTSCVIQARCYKSGQTPSCVLEAYFTISGPIVAKPVFSPGAGTYQPSAGYQSVTISCSTASAIIHYTTNGDTPTGGSPTYTGPITVAATGTIVSARAFLGGYTNSPIAQATYTIQVPTPAASPSSGTYFRTGPTVTLSCPLASASIRYTLNGTTPTGSSTLYTGPFAISASANFRARAFSAGKADSPVFQTVYNVRDGGIAGGRDHSMAFSSSGYVVTWGANDWGQLGDNTTNERHSYGSVWGTLPKIRAVSAGPQASYILGADGTVWAWGWNEFGQLGNGSTESLCYPVQVQGLGSAVAISAGGGFAYARLTDGEIWSWGINYRGQLGDGTTTDRSLPVNFFPYPGMDAAVGDHGVFIQNDGRVVAMGWEHFGQLGNGSDADYFPWPVNASGPTSVVAVAGGGKHSLALTSTGTVWAWGSDSDGQLGNGSNGHTSVPENIGNYPGFVGIDAGAYFSMALKSDGTVWTWGDNEHGQLGDGTTTDSELPSQVPGLTGIVAIAAGEYHALALSIDGWVYAWGDNGRGQLGDGTTIERTTPVRVYGMRLW